MSARGCLALGLCMFALAAGCRRAAPMDAETAARLAEIRQLGKALYESPGAAEQAVEELRKAVELAPGSHRDRLNYGLALLRAGRGEEGRAELLAVQQADPSIPHTWFNLGVEYKEAGDAGKAIEQFERMAELAPGEAKVHYNLGQLYKQVERTAEAIEKFELAARLDPSLAAPHFQLYNLFRRDDRERARREFEEFQRIKKLQEETGLSEDVNWSFYSELYDPIEAATPPAAAGPTRFESVELTRLPAGGPSGVLALDADGDRLPDALVWSGGRAALLAGAAGGPPAPGDAFETGAARSISVGDLDGDGLPELCLAGPDGAFVAKNEGGRRFAAPETVATGDFEACLWHDFDHDGDADLFLLGAENRLLLNAGGELKPGAEFPFEPGKRGLAALAVELFEDDGNDLVVVYADAIVLYEDRKLGRYDRVGPIQGAAPGAAPVRLEAVDADGDGYLDVVASFAGGRARLLRNRDGRLEAGAEIEAPLAFADLHNRGWLDAIRASGVALNAGGARWENRPAEGLPASAAAAASADFDGDGLADAVVLGADGAVAFARNRTDGAGRGFTLSIEGVKSAKFARGARVEIRAGPVYTKRLYAGAPLHFGVGGREVVETIRITWTNGMIQNETAQPARGALQIEEKPRLSGSCPTVFTWNGREFEYRGEVLGVAPLGASLGDGAFFPVDHDEYLFVPGDSLVPRDGVYEIRVTEELREVAYLDQIRLFAIDRPADVEVYTNEKFKAPPFPEFRLFGVREEQKVRPRAAVDHAGRDVSARLARRDGATVDGFRRTFRNTAEEHSVTLDLAGLQGTRDAMLFLTGWVDWADASTIVARAQAGDPVRPPVLQTRDADGEWRTVIEDLGLPGGSPRTMAVDLSGKFLSDSREVRIVTNMCVYWDEIFAADGVFAPDVRRREAEMLSAELRYRGFSRNVVHPERREPERFVYAETRAVSNWNPTPGRYTRFGPVDELLREIDDRFVILGSGDELRLRFRADPPGPPPGWARDFLVFFDGWAKENDPNTAHGDTVEPLPFHSMSGYPYPPGERRPDSAQRRRDRETYNTRRAVRAMPPLSAR